jgi:peptidoglycan/LPS O-acetylase OafA/YrhL
MKLSVETAVKIEHRFEEIDLFRFLVAISVVSFHYLYKGPAVGAMPPTYFFPVLSEWARYGYLGVHLFFMISGFVIIFSIKGQTAGRFAVSRISRLFPAFWAAIIITSVVIYFADAREYFMQWWQVLANFTMMNHLFGIPAVDGSYWSLYVELHFYFLIWLMILLGQQQRELFWITLWLLIAAAWQCYPMWKVELFLAARYAPFFAAGALICRIRTDGLSWRLSALYFLAWILSLNIMVGVSPAVSLESGESRVIIATLITLQFILMAGVGLGVFSGIKWPVVAMLGALTYPLYLLHEVIGWIFLSRMPPKSHDIYGVMAVVCLMVLIAWMINYLVERPAGPRLKRYMNSLLFGRFSSVSPKSNSSSS